MMLLVEEHLQTRVLDHLVARDLIENMATTNSQQLIQH